MRIKNFTKHFIIMVTAFLCCNFGYADAFPSGLDDGKTKVESACGATSDGCHITFTGLTGNDYIKLFDANWNIIWDCNPWSGSPCNAVEKVLNLPNGLYYTSGCGPSQTLEITGCGTSPKPTIVIGDVVVAENALTASLTITASETSDSPITVVYTTNAGSAGAGTDFVAVSATATIPAGQTSTTVSIALVNDNVAESTEHFTVTLSNAFGATIADTSAEVTITDSDVTAPIDNDNDGVPAGQDCDDNDPSVPTTPGTACNDGDANTENDVILADGCDCAGTPIVAGCFASSDGCEVTFSGLTGQDYVKLFDASYNIVWSCNPWANGGCNSTEVVSGLPNGTYITGGCGAAQTFVIDGSCGGATPALVISDVTVNEDAGSASLTITASETSTSPITVVYTTNPGSAGAGTDYTSVTATATIPAGQTSTTVTIPLVNDNTPENDEHFTVELSNPSGATIADNSGTVTILDTDVLPNMPALVISDVTVNEDAGSASLTITASETSTSPITVVYTTNPGSAGAGTDYTSVTATATIPAGQTSTTVTIPLVNDNTPENDEHFTVELSNPSGAAIADNSGTVTILDTDVVAPIDNDNDGVPAGQDCDDNDPSVPTTPGTACNDGDANTENDVILADGCDCAGTPIVAGCFASSDGCEVTFSGLNGQDYIKLFDASYNIVWSCNPWANGGCNSTEVVSGLPNGTYITGGCGAAQTFVIDGSCGGATPALVISDVTVNEDAGSASLTITASETSTSPITVVYTTNPGSAGAGTDYTSVTATATIPAGQTSTTVTIPLVNDNTPENDEHFTVELSNPSGATIADNSGTVTILDTDVVDNDGDGVPAADDCDDNDPSVPTMPGTSCDDGDATTENDQILSDGCICEGTPIPTMPTLTIGDVIVDENDGTATLTITASEVASSPIYVTYTTSPGSALAGDDYLMTTSIAIIPVGQISTTISIPLVNDEMAEVDENFLVVLTDPSGATLADGTAMVTITDTDVTDPCLTAGGDTDNDGVCDNDDCQPNNPAFPTTPGTMCDDGSIYTDNDQILADGCTCSGILIDADNDGVSIIDDCDDNDPAVPTTPGTMCDDGDLNTENDVILADGCTCEGQIPAPDADGDGVADADDCQPFNGNIPAAPGTPCDDGMANTINDMIAADGCGCAGQINAPICNYVVYDESGFENAYGIFWNDGGHSSSRAYGEGANGSHWAVELKDNNGSASSIFTNHLNLFNISKVRFDFMVRFESMEHGEDLLLEYSTNGGSNYQVAQQWISGVNINNSHAFTNVVVEIDNNFSSQTVFRFRCDASSGLDKVYLDNIKFSTCVDFNDPYAGQRPTYRSLDGSLNNFDNPEYGKKGNILAREIPAQYGDGVGSLAGPNRPSPRHISNILSDEPQDRRDERLLSGMTYQFGQFLDHDIVNSSGGAEFAPISIPGYDPLFSSNNIIPFTRSPQAPGFNTREQSNNLTSYIDASQVYGVDPLRAAWLRSFEGGKLKVSSGNQLPYNTVDGEYDSPTTFDAPEMERSIDQAGNLLTLAVTGDIRANEHPNLAAFHLIFVREHNRLCDMFVSQGETDDEIIYQKARKLVGAMMQRIVYKEFLPAMGVTLSNFTGYKSNVRPDVLNTFATAAYRWHTMVENDIILRNDNCEGIGAVELPLKSIFMNPEIIRQYGPGVLLRGLAFHPQYRTDLKVNNGLRNFLFGPGAGLDLVSINLQRGRDHGLPDYKTVRNFYGGGNVSSFSDINSDHEISSRLQLAYGNVNDIDLWSGIFAEPLVSGTSLPATAIAILKRQFESLRDGDFYYYENDPFLTSSDKSIIEGSGLADIIERNSSARHMPENIFFKPACSVEDELEDTKDELHPVCNTHGATLITSCSGTSGINKFEGFYNDHSNVRKINIELGFSVRITNNLGESVYYTDDTGCLPAEFSGSNISGIEVICLSKDESTIDCTGFAGALFSHCGGSPLPIFTTGDYNTEQLKSLAVSDNDIDAIRVNNGFQITLYEHDNFTGYSRTFVGPSVLCLPYHEKNRFSSMKAICTTDPDRSNCGFNGVAGGVFLHSVNEPEKEHIGASLGIGDYTQSRLAQMNVPNNGVRKVAVNNGYAITLFEEDDFGGNYTVYMGTESDLSTTITETHYPIWDLLGLFPYTNTTTMHNKTSSIKVRCIEGMQGPLSLASEITLEAEAENERARLDVTTSLSKEVLYQSVERYNGAIGAFEPLAVDPEGSNFDEYSFYDENPHSGDNVYRIVVFFADGTTLEAPYRTVRFEMLEHFRMFPNPASDLVNIDLEKYMGKDVDVYIYDLLGNPIYTNKFVGLTFPIVSVDLSDAHSGEYLVRVVTDGRRASTQKLTVISKR